MVLNYGETSIPSDRYTVRSGGTINVAAAFERSVAVVGAMDTNTGTATQGDAVEVDNMPDAAELFGEESELYRQIELAFRNLATTVYAVPVTEQTIDEAVAGSSSGTLSNAPLMNPDLHPTKSVSVTDDTAGTDMAVELVYESPTQPSDTDTVRINPITGEWYADASSDYTFSYSYGNYSDAIAEATTKEPRVLALCQEAESLYNDTIGELEADAQDYVYEHGVAGMNPFADPDNPDVAGYTNPVDSERLSLVGAPYGYLDDAETDMTRAVGAVAGELASLPLGVSATNNELIGLTGLRTDLSPSHASDLIDERVLPLIDYPPITIVKDFTTSTTSKFSRIYSMQVLDEVTTLLHEINREYIGRQPREENIRNLRASLTDMLQGLRTSDPPLLNTLSDEDPYAVEVTRSDSDDNVFNERIGVDVIGVIDEIDVTVVAGDVITIERS